MTAQLHTYVYNDLSSSDSMDSKSDVCNSFTINYKTLITSYLGLHT